MRILWYEKVNHNDDFLITVNFSGASLKRIKGKKEV